LYELPFRRLLELRSARAERLMDEAKEMERETNERNSEEIRNRITSK
jgi:hypothetical protein